MGWILIIALALAAFLLAALWYNLPREGWTLFAATLVFGLAGYAWQSNALQPSSPKAMMEQAPRSGEDMVNARRALFDENDPKPDYLMLSDGFARRGQFDDAAGLLRQGLAENPQHVEGWLALGLALVEHGEGFVTPPARHAYDRAYAADPENPAAPFMLGFAYLRSGDLREASAVWGELLEKTPEGAPWREDLQLRRDALDAMIARQMAAPASGSMGAPMSAPMGTPQ